MIIIIYHHQHHHHHINSRNLGGPWPPQANFANDLYTGYPLANFYNPFLLRLPLPRQSILISVGHVLGYFHVLSTISFYEIRFHPSAQNDPPTFVYWILLRSLCLVHCKALPVLYCTSPAQLSLPYRTKYFVEDFPIEVLSNIGNKN